MKNPSCVVQAFHHAEPHFALRVAIARKPVPVAVDHHGKVFIGFQPLPLERGPRVVKTLPGPGFFGMVPELAKGLFEDGGPWTKPGKRYASNHATFCHTSKLTKPLSSKGFTRSATQIYPLVLEKTRYFGETQVTYLYGSQTGRLT